MEAAAVLRTFASLGLILGTLAAVLWAVRRFDLRLPGRALSHGRLEVVERLSLDQKRSVILLRRDDREHLLLLAPDGTVTIETGFARPPSEAAPASRKPERASRVPDPPEQPRSFAAFVEESFASLARRRRTRGGELVG